MIEKKISWLVVHDITNQVVCRETSLQEALDTIQSLHGFRVEIEVQLRIQKPYNQNFIHDTFDVSWLKK